ncbi:MAG: MBL fold metallo-hydrolase [Bacteroidota bacterium]
MVHTIDLHFLDHSDTIAAFLIESGEGPILFETGPYSTFAHLTAGIKKLGYELADIKHVFLTHIHLDHAGAAWAFAEMGAHIYVHPFGAKHMHDPSKLINSATRIYGEHMERLWSTMKGIPQEQLVIVEHGVSYQIGDQKVQAWHTPGHAVHHIAWQVGAHLIAGDVAGIKIGDGPVVAPCPPPDINVEHWQQSMALIKELDLEAMYLTHFGKVTDIVPHLEALEQVLIEWSEWIKPHFERGADPKEVTPAFQAFAQESLAKQGVNKEGLARYESANPSWMSVAGLFRYWKKKLETSA